MTNPVHIIGNGPTAQTTFDPRCKGTRYTCNLPAFSVENVKATFMVDFKMMRAVDSQSVIVPGDWILGARPKRYCEMFPGFYMRYAHQIKEFYVDKPNYVPDYTQFNCGHLAVYYAAKKLKASEIHMYGFDSIFDFELRSATDFYLESDRSVTNSTRLLGNWRPIWDLMFKEFPETQFILYHIHDQVKIPLGGNVSINIRK